MASYRVLIARPLAEGLHQRYEDYPLKELLAALRERLAHEAHQGGQAPFPFMRGTLTQSFEIETSAGVFQVSPLYWIDEGDAAVEIVDIGILPIADEF